MTCTRCGKGLAYNPQTFSCTTAPPLQRTPPASPLHFVAEAHQVSHFTMVQPPLMTYMVADGSMCVPQLKSHSVLSAAAVISVGAPSVHSQLPPPLYTSAAPLYSSAAPPAAPTQARNGKRPLEENMFAGSGLGLPYGQPLQRHVTEQRHVTDVSAELFEAAGTEKVGTPGVRTLRTNGTPGPHTISLGGRLQRVYCSGLPS